MSSCNVGESIVWNMDGEGERETSAYEWFENVLTFSRDTITCNDVRYEDRVVRFKHSGNFTKVARVEGFTFCLPRFLNRTESNLKGRLRAVFGTTMKSSSRRMKTMEAARRR